MKNEWISVKDRLPEDLPENKGKRQIKVLVALKGKNGRTIRTQTRFLDLFIERWYWKYAASAVTHWMPLPELPKEESGNREE